LSFQVKQIKNIVLVNPPVKPEQVYGVYADWGGTSPPIGLCYIAAYLRENGFNVFIVDAEALRYSIEQTVSAVLSFRPQIVGLACKTLWVVSAHRVAGALKKCNPDIVIIAGGNHVTALPERSLIDFPYFDILVLGEGEVTLLKLIHAMNRKIALKKIDGIAFKDVNKIIVTKKRERIKNLDILPLPAWDLLPQISKNYKPTLLYIKELPAFSIVTSRGCPEACTFCDRSVFERKVTSHSPEYILNMLRELHFKYGIRHIFFDDDNFLFNKSHLSKLLDLIIQSDLHITFTCQSRINNIEESILKKLKKAGCWQIIIGIESGSQKILNRMRKNIFLKDVRPVLRMIQKAGIKTTGYFIIGFPGDTKETLEKTLKLIKTVYLDDIGVFLFTPLPGSSIYNEVEKYGFYKEDWELMNSLDKVVFVPEGLTKDMLLDYSGKYYNACYIRPYQAMPLLKRFISPIFFKPLIKALPKILTAG
jgi:anaerobic magnesium-protoporphyrin IX monomethyl ester cyclase